MNDEAQFTLSSFALSLSQALSPSEDASQLGRVFLPQVTLLGNTDTSRERCLLGDSKSFQNAD